MIDDQPLSWQQALGYLWLFGQLRPMIQTIVSQHIIYQELKQRDDLEVTPAEFEQAVLDFRLQQKLSDSQKFQQWLASEGMDYTAWQNRMALNLKIEKLAAKIAEPKLPEYFNQRKQSLEQIELSCLVIKEEALARQLKTEITASKTSFAQIAKDYTQGEESEVNVSRRTARRQQWPQDLQNALVSAQVGDILGPMSIENRWCLFQVEQILAAVLEGQLKRSLEAQIFKEWLAERVNQLKVQLVGTQPQSGPPAQE